MPQTTKERKDSGFEEKFIEQDAKKHADYFFIRKTIVLLHPILAELHRYGIEGSWTYRDWKKIFCADACVMKNNLYLCIPQGHLIADVAQLARAADL